MSDRDSLEKLRRQVDTIEDDARRKHIEEELAKLDARLNQIRQGQSKPSMTPEQFQRVAFSTMSKALIVVALGLVMLGVAIGLAISKW